jgi:hypothetical protein
MQLLYAQEVSPSSFENVAHAIEVMPVAAQLVSTTWFNIMKALIFRL